jgi:hypothetical protein
MGVPRNVFALSFQFGNQNRMLYIYKATEKKIELICLVFVLKHDGNEDVDTVYIAYLGFVSVQFIGRPIYSI